jgi:hypothetical protein
MNISGLSTLDPRVAATEKFIADKKIPPDQVPAFLLSMGADPRLAGLVLRYQKLKSAGGQGAGAQPPQSTVAQDIEAQQQGIAAPMAPPPNRDQGVGSLPAPVMDRAKFAGGGIVAFQNGGDTGMFGNFAQARSDQPSFIRRSGISVIREAQDLARQGRTQEALELLAKENVDPRQAFGNNVPTPAQPPAQAPAATTSVNPAAAAAASPQQALPKGGPSARRGPRNVPGQGDENIVFDDAPTRGGASVGTAQINKGLEILRNQVDALKNMKPEDREARYRAAGIEDMTPKQLAKIEERIAALSGDKKRDAYLALAQAGFKMAAAASRPGATALGALGEGASEGAKMMSDINKQYRALQSDLEDKVMTLQRYQQERKEGKIDRDIEFERELAKEIRGTEAKIGELAEESRRFDVTTQLTREQIAATRDRGAGSAEEKLKRAYVSGATPQIRQEALRRLSELRRVDVRLLAEELKAEAAEKRAAMENPFGGMGSMGSGEGWGEVRVK